MCQHGERWGMDRRWEEWRAGVCFFLPSFRFLLLLLLFLFYSNGMDLVCAYGDCLRMVLTALTTIFPSRIGIFSNTNASICLRCKFEVNNSTGKGRSDNSRVTSVFLIPRVTTTTETGEKQKRETKGRKKKKCQHKASPPKQATFVLFFFFLAACTALLSVFFQKL